MGGVHMRTGNTSLHLYKLVTQHTCADPPLLPLLPLLPHPSQTGGSVDQLLEEVTRRNLFRKEVIKKVTDGGWQGSGLVEDWWEWGWGLQRWLRKRYGMH